MAMAQSLSRIRTPCTNGETGPKGRKANIHHSNANTATPRSAAVNFI